MRHVVFDFDGTLVDSFQIGLGIYNEVADSLGLRPMTEETIAELRRLPLMDRFKAMGVPIHRMPKLVVEFTRHYRTALTRLRFFAGIPELLATLSAKGLTLHVLSSNAEDNIRDFLGQQGVEAIRTITSVPNVFGKHRALKTFLRKQGLTTGDILYVGDEERDVVACRKIAVRIAAVTWGFDAADVLKAAGADHLVASPQELQALILSLAT